MSDAGMPAPGALTAGAWDDNLNFHFYQTFLLSPPAGAPLIPRADRVVVQVNDSVGAPQAGATVELQRAGGVLDHVLTGADGRALFFPAWTGASSSDPLTVVASLNGLSASSPVDGPVTLSLPSPAQAIAALDVAVVLDTTGSMGDEISWLQRELAGIANEVQQAQPGLNTRWALVEYRDVVDDFVTRVTDFTDPASFQTALARASASGGGDYPEALDQAVAKIPTLAWRGGATARVVLHIADAPAHVGDEGTIVQALGPIRQLGVHIYPVAASGADAQLEATFRTEAEVTGGRYLFLTDDSGIGGSHEVPTVPCFYVTLLQKQLTRVLVYELTASYAEPAPADVISTSGDVSSGRCVLGDGTSLFAF
jgi:hypothetical protein